MYKAIIKNKKFYLAIHKFPKTAKKVKTKTPVYHTGIWKHDSFDMLNFFFVLGTFRIILGFPHTDVGQSCG